MSNLEKYKAVFVKVFQASEQELAQGFAFQDIERWDSFAHVTLITELEDEFNVMFAPEDILSYGSYENGMKILERYGIVFTE